MEENQDTQALDTETDLTEPKQSKSTRKQLKESLAQIDKLLKFKSMKSAKLADLAIERSGLIKLLLQIEHDAKVKTQDESIQSLTAQHEQDTQEIARLSQRLKDLNALANAAIPRVQPERIDDRIPALQEQVQTLEELLKAVASALNSSLSHVQRIELGAVIVKQRGKASQIAVSLFTDFSSLYTASQKRDSELQGTIASARDGVNSQGSAVIVAKATLEARGVGIVAPEKSEAGYVDYFA